MNVDLVADLVKIAEEEDISELRIESEAGKVAIKRVRGIRPTSASPPANLPAIVSALSEELTVKAVQIVSPMVGFFRDAKKPVQLGQQVAAGEIVGYIESLSLMNEVFAPQAGRITEASVKAGDAAQYGQVLFTLSLEMEDEPLNGEIELP